MVRPNRIDYEGAWHHVMNRGRSGGLIFQDEQDAVLFLDSVDSMIRRFNVEVHGYSLMPNHYHLLVRTPLGNLSKAMRQLGASYTQAYNRRYGTDGALFRGRFKSQLIEDEMYLTYLLAYIHLNPIRAGLVRRLDAIDAWTGHRRYMGLDSDPEWLCTQALLSRYGSRAKLKENMMSLRRKKDDWPHGMNLETGWVSDMKRRRDEASKEDASAERLTAKQLKMEIRKVTGASEKELMRVVKGPGGNVARRFAVWAFHVATCMTHREIGEVLKMRPELVAKTLQRNKANLAQFGDWTDQWLETYPHKVSYVKT